ncbi:MAG: colanic acid biosynthesis glycosyltransferase WcaI [Gloeocapsa sp. DLM2.Bin57]|nr:MAG: colanic acid biosynthesis glycosyltransferase WcaI [Gloeocapsa sp. DLM2.Bin57]
MRILIYSYNYYPEPIGIAPLMTELAEGLARRGHEVHVSTAMPSYPESEIYPEYRGKLYTRERLNGISLARCYVWSRTERNFRNRVFFELSFIFLSFWQCLRTPCPDLIFLTIPGLPVCLPGVILSKIYRRPLVLNVQDILPDAAIHVGLITNPQLINILRKLERFAYNNADKISVITESFQNNLLKKGVPENKLVEISNWVDINFIKPREKTDSNFRQENNLKDKFIVLYSGNIALTQGLENLIEAGKYLKAIEQIVIVIVGEKKAIAQLKLQAEAKKLNNILLLPFQPREKLPDMLGSADIGLVMQKHNVINFNMPSKIQLLLASGCPIIASVPALGTAALAVEKSQGGVVVPPENPQALAQAIKDLYHQPDILKKLGENGRKYAENYYSFEKVLDRYEELFKSLVNQREN